jgi:UDPglucose 6-dehydrogenase
MELITFDSGLQNKIGIIGFGFLGSSLAHGFALHADIKIYDKYSGVYNNLYETVNESDFIFVGVPTPMNGDGSQDLSNMDDAIKNVVGVADKKKIIVLRSTVIPGTVRSYAEQYTDHEFVFVPEFLTERNAKLDFINTARIIIAGDEAVWDVEELFRLRFTHTPIYTTTWEAAEVVKYMCNCFFAVKISFLNEIYDIAKTTGEDYDNLRDMFLADCRIGNSHTDVPGHDGDRGYGGKCFPKDVQAFVKWAESKGLHADICKAANLVNERVRKNKDWLDIKGATTENNYGKNYNDGPEI